MHILRLPSGQPVTHVAFSPDGAALAGAQPHTGVTLLDRAAGGPTRTVGTRRATTYTSVVFLDGGAKVAASSSKGLEVSDVATGERVGDPVAHSHLSYCRLVGCGPRLLAAVNGVALEISLPPDAPAPGWRTLWDKAVTHTIAPDGRRAVATRARAGPELIDLTTGKRLAAVRHPLRGGPYRNPYPASAADIVFAGDANRFAVCDGKTVEVFDPADEDDPEEAGGASIPRPRAVLDPVFRLDPPEPWPAGGRWQPPVALTPDGRGLLVRRPRQRVQLWDVDAGSLRCEWQWRVDAVLCLAAAPDGLTAAAGGRFGRVVTWDLG